MNLLLKNTIFIPYLYKHDDVGATLHIELI